MKEVIEQPWLHRVYQILTEMGLKVITLGYSKLSSYHVLV